MDVLLILLLLINMLVDMPGIEDAICLRKMLTYIEENRYKILPMFVVDMT